MDKLYLGIDFGTRRIGLAKSDPTGLIASPLKTITYESIKKAICEIVEIIDEFSINEVVVGYPVAPDGGAGGERCAMVDDFIARLKKEFDGPIYRMDERDSSDEAEDIIRRQGKKPDKAKGKIDRLAAAIILQRFLDEKTG
jgi:putative Holliday junction resolvase